MTQQLHASALGAVAAHLRPPPDHSGRPWIVALDGPSGAGKSTLAAQLEAKLNATRIEGDDFFAGGVQVRRDSPAERARDCIDWRRQRPVLQALLEGRPAQYLGFDWDAFDGRLRSLATRVVPSALILLEGVYSARPELSDLLDLRVLVDTPRALRLTRLEAREGHLSAWEKQWHEAEDWYFEQLAAHWFQVVIHT